MFGKGGGEGGKGGEEAVRVTEMERGRGERREERGEREIKGMGGRDGERSACSIVLINPNINFRSEKVAVYACVRERTLAFEAVCCLTTSLLRVLQEAMHNARSTHTIGEQRMSACQHVSNLGKSTPMGCYASHFRFAADRVPHQCRLAHAQVGRPVCIEHLSTLALSRQEERP